MLSAELGTIGLVMGRNDSRQGWQSMKSGNTKEGNVADPLTKLRNVVGQVGYDLAKCYDKPLDVGAQTIADIDNGIVVATELMADTIVTSNMSDTVRRNQMDTLEALTGLEPDQLEGLMADVEAYMTGKDGLNMIASAEFMEFLGIDGVTPNQAQEVVTSIAETVDDALLMDAGTKKKNTATSTVGGPATPSITPGQNPNGRRPRRRIPKKIVERIKKIGCGPQLIGIFIALIIGVRVVLPPVANTVGSFFSGVSRGITNVGETYQFWFGNAKNNPTLHDVNWNGLLSIPNSPESQVIQAGLSLTVNDLLTSYQERGEYNRDVVNSIPRALAESTVATADGLLVPGMSYNDATRLAAVVQDGLNRQNDPQGYPDRREKFLDTIQGETPEQTQALRDITGRMLDFIIDNADEYRLIQGDPTLFPPYGLIAQTDNDWLNKEFEILRSKLRDIYGLEKLKFHEESRVPIGYAIVKEDGVERYVDIHDFDAFWEEFSGDRRKNVISVT